MIAFTIRAGVTPSGTGLRFTLFDDAMISMTYARTLAETGEWVWFPGADRVQGFTNPLWTLYMSLLHRIGLEGSTAALMVTLTGIVVLLLLGLVVGRLVSLGVGPLKPGPWAAIIAGGTVPFIYPLVFWTLRGMEVGLLALLALLAVMAVVTIVNGAEGGRSALWPIAVLALAGSAGIALRFDFIVLLGPLILLALFWAPSRRSRWTILVGACLPLVLVVIALLAFQASYWGDWLPNTYRLKVEGFTLLERLGRGTASSARALPLVVLAIAALATVAATWGRTPMRRLCVLLGVSGLTPIAYNIWVGGDAWDNVQLMNRYITVGIPSLLALTFIAAGAYLQRNSRHIALRSLSALLFLLVASAAGMSVITNPVTVRPNGLAVAVGAALVASGALWTCCLWLSRAPWSGTRTFSVLASLSMLIIAVTSSNSGASGLANGSHYTAIDQGMTTVGMALEEVTTVDAVIATNFAGAPAYYSHRPMIDLLGKSDRVIATGPPAVDPRTGVRVPFFPGHSKYDATYSVEMLKPDIVVDQPWDAGDSQLAAWGYLKRCTPGGTVLYVLARSPRVLWAQMRECPALVLAR